MEWLWLLQIIINFGVIVALVSWWKDRAKSDSSGAVESQLLQLQALSSKQHQEWQSKRAVLDTHLQSLVGVCTKAKALLDGQTALSPSLGVSDEEQDLRTMASHRGSSTTARSIPSVKELEARQRAANATIPLDLRALLRDQLS